MLLRGQLKQMVTIESRINAKEQSAWVSADWNFHRAAIVACSEIMSHKEWQADAAQVVDKAPLRLKLVDILRSYVAEFLEQASGNIGWAEDALAKAFAIELSRHGDDQRGNLRIAFDGRNYVVSHMNMMSKIELMIGLATARRVSIGLFDAVLADVGITWEELHRDYIGVNMMTIFRHDHGYMDGDYVKVWKSRPDVEHLADILKRLNSASVTYLEDIYRALKARYPVRSETKQP